jgi:hypothetical protein
MKRSSFRNVAFFSDHYVMGKMQKLSTGREMIPVGGKRGWWRVCCSAGGVDGYKRVYSTATGRNYLICGNYRLFFYFNGGDPLESQK